MGPISAILDLMAVAEYGSTVRQDIRYAFRIMRKHPLFVFIAIFTLALGIGANSAIFTVVNAVLLQPLRFHDPDRLVRISGGATAVRFESIRAAKSFSAAGAFNTFTETVTLSGSGGADALKGVRITPNFLSILGIAPLAGRSFLPSEESPGPAVAMISAPLWQSRFGRDVGIVGQTVRLGGVPCTIVGILPERFAFPFPDLDVWRPYQPSAVPLRARTNSPMLGVFGRLKPDVSLDQASSEIALINRQYALANPGKLDARLDRPEQVSLLKDQLVRNVRSSLWMLLGAVGLVLLIACANVASLLLARAKSRSREFAIRAALGASRGRLATQLLTESVMLSLSGGVLGVLMAAWFLPALANLPAVDLPRLEEVRLDSTALIFTFALSVATGMLFGLAPAFASSRMDLAGVMKTNPSENRSTRWLGPVGAHGLLVIGQVALSVILLIGASLLIASLSRLRGVDPGYVAGNLLTMQLALPPSGANNQQLRPGLFDEVVRNIESVPGVSSAALTLTLPATGFAGTPVHVVGRAPLQLNERPIAVLQAVTPGYFRTMGIALKRGRDFSSTDSITAPLVAVINETMARRFWPGYPHGDDPVGQSVLAGASPDPVQIIGIVSDVRQAGLATEPDPGIYRPRAQLPPMSAMIAVRTTSDPMRLANSIRSKITAVDRDLSVTALRTMEQVIEASEGRRKGIMVLLTSFAAVGLLLSVIGIYGVVAYSVVQRTRELGIRGALGAQQTDLLKMMLRQGLAVSAVGILAGLVGAFALTRVLQGLLFEVSATDPRIFAGAAAVLLAVALAATYVPARGAMRIQPVTALRAGD